MHFPIITIPEYYFFIGGPTLMLLGFLLSLAPYCFISRQQRLWTIPIVLIPAVIILLITPATILPIMQGAYFVGFILGSVNFYFQAGHLL
jgi:hypothetical protein